MVIKPKIVETSRPKRKPLSTPQLCLLDYIQEIVSELEDLALASELPDVNSALSGVKTLVQYRLDVNKSPQSGHQTQPQSQR